MTGAKMATRYWRWGMGLAASAVLVLAAVLGGVTAGGAPSDGVEGGSGASSVAANPRLGSADGVSQATAIWEFWVTTAAHLAGAAGTNWRTDLEVHNYGGTQASFSVALLKRDQGNTSPDTRNYSLGPGQAVRYNDILASMFSFNGAAALKVSTTYDGLIVTSRTYNDQPSGTFGQFVRGRPLAEAVGPGEQGRIIQLTHHRSTSSGYRTNLLFVNATTSSMQLNIDLYLANGTYLGRLQRTLAGYEYKQIDKVFESVTGSDVTDGYAVLSSPTSGAYFFAGASVIDNRTGDAVFVPHEKVIGGGQPPTNPSYGPLTFSTQLNEQTGQPTNPGTSFQHGATKLYGSFPYSNVTPGTAYQAKWYFNGSLAAEGSATFGSSSGSRWHALFKTDNSPLDVGTYRLDIVVGGAVVLSGQCSITGGATPTPTTTPTTGSYGPITFATGVNSSTGAPINPGTSFAYGLTRLYGIWPWSGVTPNTAFRYDWYRNGSSIGGGNSTLPYASGIAWQWTDGSPLPVGTYQLVIKVNNVVVVQGQCQIVGGSTPTPTPTSTPPPTPGTGSLAFRLTWNGTNDLDLHVREPNGTHIYYNNRGPTSTGGRLDVDCNAACDSARMCSSPVENVFWPTGGAPAGTYEFWVEWYRTCSGPTPTSFTLTVYVNGAVAQTYSGSLNQANSQHYTYTLGGGGGGSGQNLTMVTPSGWSGCVVCNYREVNPPVYEFLSIHYTTHVYWAVQNTGSVAITGPVKFGFFRDGTHFFTVNYANSSGWPAGGVLGFHYALDTQSYISAGTHTFMVKADVDNAIAETNENDNTCSTTKEWTTIVFSPPDQAVSPLWLGGGEAEPIPMVRPEELMVVTWEAESRPPKV